MTKTKEPKAPKRQKAPKVPRMPGEPKRSMSLERRRTISGYTFMIPLIFGLAVLFLPNMILTIISSFQDIKADNTGASVVFNRVFVGIDNYYKAFAKDTQFKVYSLNSVKNVLTQIPVVVIFSLVMAVILNQKFKGRGIARTVFFIPVIIATGILLTTELETNKFSLTMGRVSEETEGVADLITSLTESLSQLGFGQGIVGVVVGAASGIYNVVLSSGMQIFIFLAALQEIPHSLYEAADVEGCDSWQAFWKITFPMITPQLLVTLLYSTIDSFTKPGGEIDSYISHTTYTGGQYGYGTTMSLIYFMEIILVIGAVVLIARGIIYGNSRRKARRYGY